MRVPWTPTTAQTRSRPPRWLRRAGDVVLASSSRPGHVIHPAWSCRIIEGGSFDRRGELKRTSGELSSVCEPAPALRSADPGGLEPGMLVP
jgi:hypothetical protein